MDGEEARLWRRVLADRDEAAVIRLAALLVRRGGGRLVHVLRSEDSTYCGRSKRHYDAAINAYTDRADLVTEEQVATGIPDATVCRTCHGGLTKEQKARARQQAREKARAQ